MISRSLKFLYMLTGKAAINSNNKIDKRKWVLIKTLDRKVEYFYIKIICSAVKSIVHKSSCTAYKNTYFTS